MKEVHFRSILSLTLSPAPFSGFGTVGQAKKSLTRIGGVIIARSEHIMNELHKMADPILRHWRINCEIGIGEVTGHPTIADGWIATSRVLTVADDRSWMRTKSRLYRLEDPFPDDAAMPAGARDAVMARILRNYSPVGPEQLEALIIAAEKIADKFIGPIAPQA